ncbi:EAL domain protein, partial [Vibrio parahaemolyticus V-223/04]
AD